MNPSPNQKICVVVQADNLDDFLARLIRVQKNAPWVELRMDSLSHVDRNSLALIRSHTIKPAIFCYRQTTLPNEHQAKQWNFLYEQADQLAFELLDMDLCCQPLWINKPWKTPRLISHHDVNNTPSDHDLASLITQLRSSKPSVIKLATYTHTLEDVKRLINLLLQKPDSENWIIIGMGDAGKILRIMGPYLGTYLSYASEGHAISAAGQFDYPRMQAIYRLIEESQT